MIVSLYRTLGIAVHKLYAQTTIVCGDFFYSTKY